LENTSSLHQLDFNLADGELKSMSDYKDKVLLIVNTASQCGFTPQLKELEQLHQKYSKSGLVVIAFPCNQFGKQEPGSISEITSFCELNYGTTFTIADKIDVNGDNAHPIYKHLKSNSKGFLGSKSIKWNFTKFLVGRNGETVKRFSSMTKPSLISSHIESIL
jgi:glutathione peroxidase